MTTSIRLLLFLLALGTPHLVLAQGRDFSASFGYQHLSVSDTDADGVFVDMAISVAGPLALVGALDWTNHSSQAFGFDESLSWTAASGGVRLPVGASRVVPFAQVLFGVERDSLEIESFGSDSSKHLLMQPGGGMAVRIFKQVSVIGQVDWRHVSRDEDRNGMRLAFGARVTLH